MNILERAKAPTPKFFRILRSIGLALLGISGSIVASPVILPIFFANPSEVRGPVAKEAADKWPSVGSAANILI